jgi:hypothetical protein
LENPLEEAADVFFWDPECYHVRTVVYLGDCVCWDQAPLAGEETALYRQGVWDVREGAVHRALHSADYPAAVVGYQETRRVHQIQSESGDVATVFPVCKEKPSRR